MGEALMAAIQRGDMAEVQYILQDGTLDLDTLNERGLTYLGTAAQFGQLEITETLLKTGSSVNMADFYGQTPLQYATNSNYVDVMKCLIDTGANLNWMDVKNDGISALHIAAIKGHTEAAHTLVQAGADLNVQDIDGVCVLHCAVANSHSEIVKELLEAGASTNLIGSTTNRTPIFLAVEAGNEDVVRMLVKKRATKLNLKDGYGMTALCAACIQDKPGIAKCLINAGAKVNIADYKNKLPLHYAARNGNVDLIKTLLRHGSQMDVLSNQFETPLHMAVGGGHVDAVKILVEAGCDVNICEEFTYVTALHVAVNVHSDVRIFEPILKELIKGNCWLDCRAFSSLETPLYRAVASRKIELATLLLQHGADPSVECPFGMTVLQKACEKGTVELVHTLLYCNIDWTKETWLDSDIYRSGINPKLLTDYDENIPTVLLHDVDLFNKIQTFRYTTISLVRICRNIIRRCLKFKLYIKVEQLLLPNSLKQFLMLSIL